MATRERGELIADLERRLRRLRGSPSPSSPRSNEDSPSSAASPPPETRGGLTETETRDSGSILGEGITFANYSQVRIHYRPTTWSWPWSSPNELDVQSWVTFLCDHVHPDRPGFINRTTRHRVVQGTALGTAILTVVPEGSSVLILRVMNSAGPTGLRSQQRLFTSTVAQFIAFPAGTQPATIAAAGAHQTLRSNTASTRRRSRSPVGV